MNNPFDSLEMARDLVRRDECERLFLQVRDEPREFRWIKVKIIDDTPGDELWIEELKEVDVDLEEMKADIALEIRVGVDHSDECFETYGRLPCICAVERAARIVEAWSPSEKEEE